MIKPTLSIPYLKYDAIRRATLLDWKYSFVNDMKL